jgi:hypothetical protein
VAARVSLAHAVVQHVADRTGADVLHLKGPALFPDLRPAGRASTDVDVLVRPRHVHRLISSLAGLGWEQRTDFATGSAFGHAANWWHDDWGYVDVHTSWPGAGAPPETVFDVLASSGTTLPIAHVDCPVPDRVGQLFVLVLHAARSLRKSDVAYAWTRATDEERAAVEHLARRLDAEVALAAALGRLEDFADRPEHDLWAHFSSGSRNRVAEWRARWRAAPGWQARWAVLDRLVRVNRDHLRMELGRPPTRREIWRRQARRVSRLVRDLPRPGRLR